MRTANNGARARGNDTLGPIKDDIAALKADLSSLVGGRLDALRDGAHMAAKGAGETGSELFDGGKRRAIAMHRRLGDAAGAHPIKTVVIAAAAGVIGVKVLGWIWRR